MRRFFPSTIRQVVLGDEYALGWGLRKINPSYTGSCIRIERTSDNTQQDIGFSGDYVDTTAISSFCGASSGVVRIIYFQGTFDDGVTDFNLISTTLALSPNIYDGANFFLLDGKASIKFAGANYILVSEYSSNNFCESDFFWSHVFQSQSNASSLEGIATERNISATTRRCAVYSDTRTGALLFNYAPDSSNRLTTMDIRLTALKNTILSVIKDGTNANGYIDGDLQASSLASLTQVYGANTRFELGLQGAGGNSFSGLWTEWVGNNDADLTKLSALMTTQKSYYSIP